MRIRKAVEGLVPDLSSTSVAEIERELTKLEKRRTELAESLDAATYNAISTSTVRRELIIANRDQRAIEEASAKLCEAEERRVALDDALRTLEQKITETTKRLDGAKDQAERDHVAQHFEQEADAIDKAAMAVDKAAKQFASAYGQLRSAMSPASCMRTPERERLADDRVASMIAVEALAGASPSSFHNDIDEFGSASVLSRGFPLGEDLVRFKTRDAQELEASSGRKHVEANITARLRAKALAIRSREELATLPSPPPDPIQHLTRQRPAQRHVLFLEPVRYIGQNGRPVLHAAWTAHVPLPVAEEAIKRGLALDADTAEARNKMTEMMQHRPRRGPAPHVSIEDTIDLGIDLTESLELSVGAT
jgi:hypothetical protein